MLFTVGFNASSYTSPLPKVKSERKSNGQEQNSTKDDRSDLTIGSETSVASSTMFAILQMAEGAPDGSNACQAEADAALQPPAGPLHPDETQIWWINHPLMRREFSLDDKIDDCYAEMKRIIESNPDHISESNDFESLKAAIADRNIRFPVMNGSKQLFTIIEIFFDEQSTQSR